MCVYIGQNFKSPEKPFALASAQKAVGMWSEQAES